MTPRAVIVIAWLAATTPALAGDELAAAPAALSLLATTDPLDQSCRRIAAAGMRTFETVPLYRTFHDDFDQHPLASGRWVPHYAGGASWPEANYWGGAGSDFKRKDAWNGEQQIYVDPRYGGRSTTPLGLDPFKVRDGVLSIEARRTPAALKDVLFDNEFISGILTTQASFSQKYGYFEIRAKIPVGTGVWPAFWMLANDGGWPPEIDVMEGRGQRPGDLVMTTHWRIRQSGRVESCGFDFVQPDASTAFHDYGVLWERDRIVYFIDRKPVSDIRTPIGFDDPMYMIVNLAMGAKNFQGVGFVDGETPNTVAFEIDRISAYQIDQR
ncbi:glycoside hydrolase family 16 protein [Bradyrhizobium sp. NP1]|uniref:glycoside hydrolase family 16 protein n=1 Tax=Bradyrhizobium sp. NP1 TaxID=3049772 RepID=UPI0025A658D2|nr:glycoside hydrolase family 16 protein [Bradyrhizobium sp. NP1]WJR80228.1 glycoside hydrolase family 16 protein [Bradyrhizobium sp. NP1]